MKTKLLLTLTALLAAGPIAALADPTAYALAKSGDQYVGDQSKDKVVQIRSDRSAGTLTPNIWYVVYYDPDAPLKAVEVKFGSGQKMDVSRPFRLLEPIGGNDRVLESAKLKTDSDRALNIASGQPLLQNMTLTSSQMWLQHGDEGPQWKVKLWAAKYKDSSRQVDIGDTLISAADGHIIKSDVHPDRVN